MSPFIKNLCTRYNQTNILLNVIIIIIAYYATVHFHLEGFCIPRTAELTLYWCTVFFSVCTQDILMSSLRLDDNTSIQLPKKSTSVLLLLMQYNCAADDTTVQVYHCRKTVQVYS